MVTVWLAGCVSQYSRLSGLGHLAWCLLRSGQELLNFWNGYSCGEGGGGGGGVWFVNESRVFMLFGQLAKKFSRVSQIFINLVSEGINSCKFLDRQT